MFIFNKNKQKTYSAGLWGDLDDLIDCATPSHKCIDSSAPPSSRDRSCVLQLYADMCTLLLIFFPCICPPTPKVFAKTSFKTAQMIAVSARPGGADAASVESDAEPIGVQELVNTLKSLAVIPERDTKGPFLFSVDHCFAIKGQGTVLTGTVLSGSVKIGDQVELAGKKEIRKVKSMQMFRKPVNMAVMGDRLGICVTQLDAKAIERAVLCTPDSLPSITCTDDAQHGRILFY